MEWLTFPGLGDGELEFVDVGVVDSLSENLSSSWGGDVADCNAGSIKKYLITHKIQQTEHNKYTNYKINHTTIFIIPMF